MHELSYSIPICPSISLLYHHVSCLNPMTSPFVLLESPWKSPFLLFKSLFSYGSPMVSYVFLAKSIVSWQNLIENPMTWRKNSMPGADEGNFLPAIAGVWPGTVDSAWRKKKETQPGWWFGAFYIFPYVGNNNQIWLVFFRGRNHQPAANWGDFTVKSCKDHHISMV